MDDTVEDWYVNECPDCHGSNGMTRSDFLEDDKLDPHSPLNTKCIHCGGGPMIAILLLDAGEHKNG